MALKKIERNAGCLSFTPTELHKKPLNDPNIGPVLQLKEAGTRPFGQEVCITSVATSVVSII